MGRDFLGAVFIVVVTLGRAPAQAPGEGRIRLEGPSPSERRVYGGSLGMELKSLLPREEELARRLFTSRPGGGAVTLETVQSQFSAPAEGPPPTDGNGVLLTWGNLGGGEVKVFVDDVLLGTLPAGSTSAMITGMAVNCDPKSDPGCTANLPAGCVSPDLSDPSINVHLFKVEATGGSSQVQCQQVLPTVPVFTHPECCLRLSVSDSNCNTYFENHPCANRVTSDGSCDIIVGGSNDGPEGSTLEVFVDDKSGFMIDRTDSDLFCFERTAQAGTRGTHQVTFQRSVFRNDAATIFWSDPDGTGFFSGLVGAFTGDFTCPDTISTTCGKPKAPTDMMVRQVSYGAGKTNAVRASWLNGEHPYAVGINVFLDGAKVGNNLPGDSTDTLLTALSSANHQVDVQGDSGLTDGPSDKTGLAMTLKSTAPFPAVTFGNLQCSFTAAGGGKTTASWQPPAGLALIDVLVKLASGGDFFLVGTLGGDANGMVINGTHSGDAIQLQPLKVLDGQLYGLTPVDLSCGGATGSGQFPGDMNQDGTVDLSDAVKMLSFLFLGDPLTLPCGATTSAANMTLLNWNGDGAIDLSDPVFALQFLFLGGPTHHSGPITVCKPITGCPARCSAP